MIKNANIFEKSKLVMEGVYLFFRFPRGDGNSVDCDEGDKVDNCFVETLMAIFGTEDEANIIGFNGDPTLTRRGDPGYKFTLQKWVSSMSSRGKLLPDVCCLFFRISSTLFFDSYLR